MNATRNCLQMEIDAIEAMIDELQPGDCEPEDLLARIDRLPKPIANSLRERLWWECLPVEERTYQIGGPTGELFSPRGAGRLAI